MNRLKTSILLKAACISLLFSVLVFSQTTSGEKTVFVRFNVIDDKGRAVTGLKKENFKLQEGKVYQDVTYFSGKEEPASVGILVDISDSMRHDEKLAAAKSMLKFIQTSSVDNDYSIMVFGDNTRNLVDWGCSDEEIVNAIKSVITMTEVAAGKQGGRTALNDALLISLEKFEKAKYPNKVLLLFSDGQENSSKAKFAKVTESLKNTDVRVFSICLSFPDDPRFLVSDYRDLDDMATINGGWSYFPSRVELDDIAESLAQVVRSQYIIGYTPKPGPDKPDWRPLKIGLESTPVKRSSLSVLARKGFYFSSLDK